MNIKRTKKTALNNTKVIENNKLYSREDVQELLSMSYEKVCIFFNHPKLKIINTRPQLVLGKHLLEHLETIAEKEGGELWKQY